MNLQKHEIDAIADLTVRLTKMRQDNCAHLCVESVAPEIFGRLVMAYKGEAPSGQQPGPIIFEPGSLRPC